jgi:hypothetical protein
MVAAYGLLPTPLLRAFMMPQREEVEVELDRQSFHFPSVAEFDRKTALSQIVTAFDGHRFALCKALILLPARLLIGKKVPKKVRLATSGQ